MVKCSFPSWDKIHMDCKAVAKQIKQADFRPDVVIALSRGGFVPARTLCDLLIIKNLVSIKLDHWGITAEKDGKAKLRYPVDIDLTDKNVLIVDDITDTGESMILAMDWVMNKRPKGVKTAAIYHINHSKFTPDFYAMEIPKDDWVWVVWPWNFTEDRCNFLKEDLSKPHSFLELKDLFRDKHKVDISDALLEEALLAAEEHRIIKQSEKGKWEKV